MIKFKWHTIVEWYSFMATIAIVGLTLYGSKGTIASLRTSLVEVIVIFIFIVLLSLLWAFSAWVASNAVDFFRSKLKLKGKLTKVDKAKNQLDPTTPKEETTMNGLVKVNFQFMNSDVNTTTYIRKIDYLELTRKNKHFIKDYEKNGNLYGSVNLDQVVHVTFLDD